MSLDTEEFITAFRRFQKISENASQDVNLAFIIIKFNR